MDLTWAHKVFLGGYRLPQTPARITFEHEDRTEVIRLANGNSFTIGRKDGPMTVKFEFYVTYDEYPFTYKVADYNDVKRFEWSDILWEWKQKQTPIKLDIVRAINEYKNQIRMEELNAVDTYYMTDEQYSNLKVARRNSNSLVFADVSMNVLLTDWTFEEDADHGSDWKFTVTLLEYVPAINQEVNFDIEHHLVQNRTAKGWRSGGRWHEPGT